MRRYDFIAIGGGNAGLTAASQVAHAGRRTALVDRGPIGGLCSLNGCNPKKVLVRSTEVLDEIRRAAELGIELNEPQVDWSRVIDRKERFTSGVTAFAEGSLRQQGIDLLQGAHHFIAKNALEVNGEHLKASAVLIATGSTPRPLKFAGAELLKTSDDLLALRVVPPRLAIIGAGAVAFELGHVFARLGSHVTLFAPGTQVLRRHEADLVATLIEFSAARLGIELIVEVTIQAVSRQGEGLTVEIESQGRARTVQADLVLNAAGRIPSLNGLALDQAEVKTDAGGVVVDEFLRSPSNRQVFAAGDAHGRLPLSPVASYEGRIVARNFLEGDKERVSYEAIPQVLFTIPPLASVGLTEAQARERGLGVSVITRDMADWTVYAIAGEPVARAKVMIESGSSRILGAHLLGGGAAENIHLFAMAIRFGIPADDLKGMVFGYPTFASALPYTLG